MSQPIVIADNIGKEYNLGEMGRINDSLRDLLSSFFQRKNEEPIKKENKRFWANQNISFSIKPGEVVGFVGNNGAGKSTLLKILSRITNPTEGSIRIRGKVGALLEVGTGFHPELTGMENIFLNGAMLGLTKKETRKRLDQIIEFAGVEAFLDTPVKRYSSGMRVRLGFAVAAHMDPEVLIVDEVLAVGDADFQKKCLNKMHEVSTQSGRTVLFVSHNMGAIRNLCSRVICLERGKIKFDGPTEEGIENYMQTGAQRKGIDLREVTDREGEGKVRCVKIEVIPDTQNLVSVSTGQPVCILFHMEGKSRDLKMWFTIADHFGTPVATFHTTRENSNGSSNHCVIECHVEELPLKPGLYRINYTLYSEGSLQDKIVGAVDFEVAPGFIGKNFITPTDWPASVVMKHHWGEATEVRSSQPVQ